MRTLKHLRKDKQERIFAKLWKSMLLLAHRLGISRIKWELKTCPFRYLNEVEFTRFLATMKENVERGRNLWTRLPDKIKTHTAEQGLAGDVWSSKAYSSIYPRCATRKALRSNLHDLIAIRCHGDGSDVCRHVGIHP